MDAKIHRWLYFFYRKVCSCKEVSCYVWNIPLSKYLFPLLWKPFTDPRTLRHVELKQVVNCIDMWVIQPLQGRLKLGSNNWWFTLYITEPFFSTLQRRPFLFPCHLFRNFFQPAFNTEKRKKKKKECSPSEACFFQSNHKEHNQMTANTAAKLETIQTNKSTPFKSHSWPPATQTRIIYSMCSQVASRLSWKLGMQVLFVWLVVFCSFVSLWIGQIYRRNIYICVSLYHSNYVSD